MREAILKQFEADYFEVSDGHKAMLLAMSDSEFIAKIRAWQYQFDNRKIIWGAENAR